jgi:hypothetical protein
LVGSQDHRTQFWKGAIQGSFHKSFVAIGTKMAAKLKIEKRGDEIKKKSSLKLLSQFQPNFAEMILRWSPFKIVSISAVLYPRWPPLLKIEISSTKFG